MPVRPRRSRTTSDAVRREWLRRVEAEYRSAARTQQLTLWLLQIGASPDLVRAGLRIAGDEVVHASMSHRVFLAAGGEGGPRLERESLALTPSPGDPLEYDLARVAGETFCLGETVAVPLFKELREACKVPIARRALDRILRDEVRHRAFGWLLLESLFAGPEGDALRGLVAGELPAWFARLRRAYAPAQDGAPVTDADAAWGLMPVARYRAAVEKALARDWIPRFRRCGIDARTAWERASGEA